MTGLAIWGALRRSWPILAAIAVVIAVSVWHNGKVDAAYKDGVTHERAAWQVEAARLRAVAATEAAGRVAAVNRAMEADNERAAAVARLLAPINVKVTAYETSQRGRVVCLDDAGRMLAQAAIAGTRASAATSPGPRR